MRREQLILEIAHEVGFDLAGIAPLRPPQDARRFEAWLAEGRHGSMEYLEKNADRILDPCKLLPTGRSIVAVGFAHSRPEVRLTDGARVARYAAGRDYHTVLQRKLRKLSNRLRAEGLVGRERRIVDAAPLLERSHAEEAGLGFASKAANLLHPRFGPWFFLGELLIEMELEPTTIGPTGSCGSCTACLDACPTAAIRAPGVVDARACISYQTIENRGPMPAALRPKIGEWAFGCDVCSEVCPWGHRAPDLAERFGVHSAVADAGLVEWLEAGDGFSTWMEGSPLKRPRREGLARNAAIGLGVRPSDSGRRALLKALTFDPAPLVREAAGWALAHGHGSEVSARNAIEVAAAAETDPVARAALLEWRAACASAEA